MVAGKTTRAGIQYQNVRDDMKAATVWPNGHGSKNVYETYGKLTVKEMTELLD